MREVLRRRYGELSAVGVVLGIVLILISEVGHVEQTRIFGAVLISVGAVGLGIQAGLRRPASTPPPVSLDARMLLGIAAALLLTLPLLLALFLGLIGAVQALTGSLGWLGAIVTFVFAALSVATLALTVRAIVRAARPLVSAGAGEPSVGRGP